MFEQIDKFTMGNEPHVRGPNRAHCMVHLLNEQTLGVWHFSGNVKRDVLPATIRQRLVAADHALNNDD